LQFRDYWQSEHSHCFATFIKSGLSQKVGTYLRAEISATTAQTEKLQKQKSTCITGTFDLERMTGIV